MAIASSTYFRLAFVIFQRCRRPVQPFDRRTWGILRGRFPPARAQKACPGPISEKKQRRAGLYRQDGVCSMVGGGASTAENDSAENDESRPNQHCLPQLGPTQPVSRGSDRRDACVSKPRHARTLALMRLLGGAARWPVPLRTVTMCSPCPFSNRFRTRMPPRLATSVPSGHSRHRPAHGAATR